MTDVLVGLPQSYQNSYAETGVVSLSPNADGMSSFKALNKKPPRPGSILVGGLVSLSSIAAFGLMLSVSQTAQPKPELLLFHPSGPLLS